MNRHNENQKMDKRLRAEENKKAGIVAKGLAERNQMEQKFKLPLLWFVGDSLKTFFRLKDTDEVKSFQVTLAKPMPIQQIRERMMKAFGDIE